MEQNHWVIDHLIQERCQIFHTFEIKSAAYFDVSLTLILYYTTALQFACLVLLLLTRPMYFNQLLYSNKLQNPF